MSTKNNNIRDKLSKILIKWGMPTRQVAINEIIELFRGQIKIGEKTVFIDERD